MTHVIEFCTRLKTLYATNGDRPRRPRQCIEVSDAQWAKMPECQRTLIAMKNAGWSYQMIADSLANGGNTISPALVNKVANGECNSARIEAALGLAEEMVTVPKSLVHIRPRSKTPRGKRQRLNIEDPTGERTRRFNWQRNGQSKGDYLDYLLALDCGEIPY